MTTRDLSAMTKADLRLITSDDLRTLLAQTHDPLVRIRIQSVIDARLDTSRFPR